MPIEEVVHQPRVHQVSSGTVARARAKELLDKAVDTPKNAGSESEVIEAEATVVESSESDSDQVTIISIYRKECVECGHLVPHLKEVRTKCHWTRGNDDCPAKSFRLKQVIPMQKIANNLAKYTVKGNIEDYNRVFNKLVEYSRKGVVSAEEFTQIKDMEAAEVERLRKNE